MRSERLTLAVSGHPPRPVASDSATRRAASSVAAPMPVIHRSPDGACGFAYEGPVVDAALAALLTNSYLGGATVERIGDTLRLRVGLAPNAPYGAYQALLSAARLFAPHGRLSSFYDRAAAGAGSP